MNWSEVGGFDQEIYVVGCVEGFGMDILFCFNMFGSVDVLMEGVDICKGQNQQVVMVVQQNLGVIVYMVFVFIGLQVLFIGIEFEGMFYEFDKDVEYIIFDSDYLLNCDFYQYMIIMEDMLSGMDMCEVVFINMFFMMFGQKFFVEDNNYILFLMKDIEFQKSKFLS